MLLSIDHLYRVWTVRVDEARTSLKKFICSEGTFQ